MKVTIALEGAGEVRKQLDAIGKASTLELKKAVAVCAFKIEGDAKRLIQQGSRTGRIYSSEFWTDKVGRLRLGRERSVAHQASAPGEPPKTDRGGLVQGISTQFEDNGMAATTGSRAQAFWGRLLELGTSKIEPRPWLSVVFTKNLQFIENRLAQAADTALSKAGR